MGIDASYLHRKLDFIKKNLKQNRLEIFEQAFVHRHSLPGINLHTTVKGPRSDGTESIVLMTSIGENSIGSFSIKLDNDCAIAILLGLAKRFSSLNLWAKDVIFLFIDGDNSGLQYWLKEYADLSFDGISAAGFRNGVIQGAINLEYPGDCTTFGHALLLIEGINGLQPNLDLVNTASRALSHRGISISLTKNVDTTAINSYEGKMTTLLSMMKKLAFGYPANLHGQFLKYRVDAITIHCTSGSKTFNLFNILGAVESTIRSINSLLEHFHQSFFFYVLPHYDRYVSIGMYIPVSLCLSASFLFSAFFLWFKDADSADRIQVLLPIAASYGFPLISWALFQFSSILELIAEYNWISLTLLILSLFNLLLPFYVSKLTRSAFKIFEISPSVNTFKASILMLACMSIACMSVINFSLSFFLGYSLILPFLVFQPVSFSLFNWLQSAILCLLSPPIVLAIAAHIHEMAPDAVIDILLSQRDQGSWTCFLLCSFYWPLLQCFQVLLHYQIQLKLKKE